MPAWFVCQECGYQNDPRLDYCDACGERLQYGTGEKVEVRIFAELKTSVEVFRKLARKYHPDGGGNTEVMKDLNVLWEAVKADVAARK